MNMALDEVLLGACAQPWLRWYGWERAMVSVGYFGSSPADAGEGGEGWVRRWTGGGRVAHGGARDSTFAIGVPRAYPESRLRAADAYGGIHRALVAALGDVGQGAVLASAPAGEVSLPCFANPVPYDVLDASGEKIAGGAQRRARQGLLHQGSVQGLELDDSFAAVFAARLGGRWREAKVSPEVIAAAGRLAETKYRSAAWLGRA